MYDLQILGTAPEAEGLGYASALVNAVIFMADAEGRDVWLTTALTYKFYERLGFVIVGKDVVGADNPEWHGEPIPIHIMHRSSKTIDGTIRDAIKAEER
ncbi:hypothetical protein BD414DRAFT_16422 [Trametes punicea]|nr:hypothetical protein BD414DRAFT_16422 [Trametes punicea]